jgi:eukaryotic-like serine/threonine-protein kinase
MKPERMRKVERIYLKASRLDESSRNDFLRKACLNNEGLRREIDSLLKHEKESESFLESPALQELAPSLADSWVENSAPEIDSYLGRYKILEELGSGGIGMVYRAYDTHLGRTVALKVLKPGMMVEKELRTRFVREAKAASALNHPNIVTIYDMEESEGIEFIAMELVQGATVRNILSERPFILSEALDYAIQTTRALHAAHCAGIIHRDIKPENIMVASSPTGLRQVKLLDFGLAKLSELYGQVSGDEAHTIKGTILGTTAYMSPEQAEGREIDERSDIFSIGAVLYEMLSGRRAFEGKSHVAVLNAVINKEPLPLTGIPEELQNILSCCLNKDPGLRFQNASDLALELEACRSYSLKAVHHRSETVLAVEPGISLSAKTMLAVLPFNNLSCDKEQDYFSDGLTEEMITELGRLNPKHLGVIAQATAMHVRDAGKNADEIGRELGVQYILEGSVRRTTNRVRITAKLIQVLDQTYLWTATYDRQLEDILDIQQDVAHRIAQSLAMELFPSVYQAGSRAASRIKDAHELYLKGLYYWKLRTEEGFLTAIKSIEKAIELDPTYALAHSGLARVYDTLGLYGGMPPDLACERAKEHAKRALEIDGALAEAHAALGYALLLFDWDWVKSETAFQVAIDNNPNYAEAHQWYALMLALQGNFNDALHRIDVALQLDPLSPLINSIKGWIFYFNRRYQESAVQLRHAIRIDDKFALAHYFLGLTYLQATKPADAIREFNISFALSGDHPGPVAGLGYAKGLLGKKSEALLKLESFKHLAGLSHVSPFFLSWIYLGLGNADAALEQLEQAYSQRCGWMPHLYVDPIMDALRPDPRFQNLLRRIGFPQTT